MSFAATQAFPVNHTAVTWVYLTEASLLSGVPLLRRDSFPIWSTLMAVLAVAYLLAPATYWRPLLTLLLFLWSLFTAIGFARGREAETVVDPRFPARLPLRRPKRVYGLREIAFAVIAGALAFTFGSHLFMPAPPPEEAPAAQEETVAPDSAEAPADSADTKKQPDAEPPAAEPETHESRAGDTFKSIAKRVYGDASKAPDIARANPDVKPNAKLRAGRKIKLPAPAKPAGG